MKKITLLLLLLSTLLTAKVNIAVSYPFIAELTKAIGGEHVEVHTLAKGSWDPHFVVPRPSLIRVLSRADLLIINGGQLEIGWMPPLIRKSHNSNVQQGAKGFLDLSHYIELINKPNSVSRSGGDVHPNGNPHFSTDPFLMTTLAHTISLKLATLDPKNAQAYSDNALAFKKKWDVNLLRWQREMAPLKGTKVVQYHELFNYFLKRFELISIGNIEPLPGISPSAKHTVELIENIKTQKVTFILQDVYHNSKTANYIAEKTGVKVLKLAHDVDALKTADSLENLYNSMVLSFTQK